MSNFGSFSYFQTFLSLGVEQGLQKLPKFDINDLRLSFHCNILIPRKCPRKTLFKAQWGLGETEPHPIFGRSVNPIQTKIMPAAKLMYDDFITSSTGWG